MDWITPNKYMYDFCGWSFAFEFAYFCLLIDEVWKFLTQWEANKMAIIFSCILLIENDDVVIQISLNFVLKGPIYKTKPLLVQVLALHRTRNKPLPRPILSKFCDAISGH